MKTFPEELQRYAPTKGNQDYIIVYIIVYKEKKEKKGEEKEKKEKI